MARALVFDLDDTLLNRTKRIGAEAQDALLKAIEAKFVVILATSRPIRAVRHFVPHELLERCTVISLNGGVTHHSGTSLTSSSFGAIGASLPRVIESLEGASELHWYSIETDGTLFATNLSLSDTELWDTHSASQNMVLPIDRIAAASATKIAVEGNGREIHNTIGLAHHFPDLRFIPALNNTFVSIVPAHVDKSTTLIKVADSEGIDLEQSFAFGDDMPDIDMLSIVGTRIAMANAKAEVKQVASHTIGDCDSDAIAKFVKHHVLV